MEEQCKNRSGKPARNIDIEASDSSIDLTQEDFEIETKRGLQTNDFKGSQDEFHTEKSFRKSKETSPSPIRPGQPQRTYTANS